MLATLVAVCKDHDTKAESNRRSKVCDVLAGTGISCREKWLAGPEPRRRLVEHQGIAPCNPAWKAGVYLSTPMLEKED
jgi:hypothetical protein